MQRTFDTNSGGILLMIKIKQMRLMRMKWTVDTDNGGI